MTLTEQVGRALVLAGYTQNDPALLRIREWNRAALDRIKHDNSKITRQNLA